MKASLLAVAALSLPLASAISGCSANLDEDAEGTEGALTAAPLTRTTVYPPSRTQSPITPTIAKRLQTLPAGSLRSDVFAKIGDSQTVNAGFMHCFNDSSVDLGDRAELDLARQSFLSIGNGADTFDRESLSAKVGASASFALGGPLLSEVAAISPRYAVVMYGSNDIQNAPAKGARDYARDILKITDTLLEKGVVPILTSPPPRPLRDADIAAFGPKGADPWVPRFSNVVRAIAQARQVPFVDLQRELRRIPAMGIGSDRLHLNSAPGGSCRLDEASLRFGMNVRNLVTLEALGRARAAVEKGDAPEAESDGTFGLAGTGTDASPFDVRELPFADLRSMNESAASGEPLSCSGMQGLTPRFTYKFQVGHTASVHFGLYGAAGAKAELVVLKSDGSGSCRSVAKGDAALSLEAGDYQVVVGTRGSVPAGEYMLTVTPDLDPT